MIAIKIVGYVLLALIALIVIVLHFSATVKLHAARDGFSVKIKFMGFTLYPRKPKAAKPVKQAEPARQSESKDAPAGESSADSPPDVAASDEPEAAAKAAAEDITDDELMHGLTEEQERTLIEDTADEENAQPEREEDDGGEKWDGEPDDDEPPPEPAKKEKKKSKKSDSSKKEGGLGAKLQKARSTWEKVKPYLPMGWKYFKKLLKTVRFYIDDVRIVVGREDAHEAAIYYGMINSALAELFRTLAMVFTCKVKRCTADVKWAENYIDARADMTVRVRPSTLIAIVVCVGVRFLGIFISQKIKNKKNKKANNKSIENNGSAEPAL